jgi:hypothetical protein
MSTITFTCPHCSHSVQLPADTLGKQGNCPGCKTMVQIVATPQQPLPQQPLPQQPLPQQPLPQQPQQQQPQQQQPQQQPLPQQPLQNSQIRGRSGNRNKLIAGSAVGIVILLITISLFFLLGGNGSANVAGTTSGASNNTNVPTADRQPNTLSTPVTQSATAPRRPSDVTEGMVRAFVIAESSETDALTAMQKYMISPDDAEDAYSNAIKNNLSESTLEQFQEQYKKSYNHYIEHWIKIISMEKKGITLDAKTVKWSEMKIIATIDNFAKDLIDPTDYTHFSSVTFLSKGNEYFYLLSDEIGVYPALPKKFNCGDDIITGSVNRLEKYYAGWGWPPNLADRLRDLDDKELTVLIALLETKGFD